MSTDIVSCLQIDTNLPGRIILVKEINGCDSSFIDNCVLSHCIKNKSPIIIISLHNSLNHYQNVGLKMNYSIQRHIESGLIEFYNLSEVLVNDVLNNRYNTIEDIFFKVEEKILAKQQNGSFNIIIDGLSHLFDLQYTLKEVNWLVKQIFRLMNCNNSFLLCHCNDATEDDVTHTMSNLLVHMSHTVVEVETLSSGWSTDVSGHLTVKNIGQKFQDVQMLTMDLKPTKYLFKLFDRGVKLLAPGTVN